MELFRRGKKTTTTPQTKIPTTLNLSRPMTIKPQQSTTGVASEKFPIFVATLFQVPRLFQGLIHKHNHQSYLEN